MIFIFCNLVEGALPLLVKRVRFGHGASLGRAAAFDIFYKNPPISHVLDLPTASLPAGSQATFTFYWKSTQRWEGTDYTVTVENS